jgi:hypothetical protein
MSRLKSGRDGESWRTTGEGVERRGAVGYRAAIYRCYGEGTLWVSVSGFGWVQFCLFDDNYPIPPENPETGMPYINDGFHRVL